jgi:hypothetical protein
MDPYAFSLALGTTGLVVMALRGLGHHAGHAGHAQHMPGHHGPHTDHGAHNAPLSSHAHGHGHAQHGQHDHHGYQSQLAAKLWPLLSPRVLFSVLVGGGASGLLLGRWLFEPFVALGAVAGGALFERYVVTPLWNFLLRFESAPALTLEHAVFESAQAVMDFDAQGQGVIAVDLNGQLVQVLGILRPEERAMGIRVRRGGRVRIEAVDAARNRCIVSYLRA